MFYYHTLKELEDLVNENKLEVWQVIEQSDMEENGRTKEQSYEKKLNMYLAMSPDPVHIHLLLFDMYLSSLDLYAGNLLYLQHIHYLLHMP